MKIPLDALIEHEVGYLRMAAQCVRTPFAWFLHGPEIPDYRDANHAVRLRDDGRGPEAVAREVITYFRSRGLTPVADIDVVAEAQGIGFALRRLGVTPFIGDYLLMRYDASGAPIVPDRGISVERTPNETGQGEGREWIETVQSQNIDGDDASMWLQVAEREARSLDCMLYLARRNGIAVGAGDLYSGAGWGRVDSVVTRPEFRRQGVAFTLVAEIVRTSLTIGNTVTYLFTEAGGAGEQVYRKLGFVPWGVNVFRRHSA